MKSDLRIAGTRSAIFGNPKMAKISSDLIFLFWSFLVVREGRSRSRKEAVVRSLVGVWLEAPFTTCAALLLFFCFLGPFWLLGREGPSPRRKEGGSSE